MTVISAVPDNQIDDTVLYRADAPTLEIDVELSRIAIGLKKHGIPSAYRLWLILRYEMSTTNTGGYLPIKGLHQLVRDHDVSIGSERFRQLLNAGNGLFWDIDRGRKRAYLRGYERVAELLVALALEHKPQLIDTNLPGTSFREISIAGSLADFESACFNAWINYKNERAKIDRQPLSNATLSLLWGRSRQAIQNWKQIAGIETIHNYAQFAPATHNQQTYENSIRMVPAHADVIAVDVEYTDGVKQETAFSWQTSNSYHPTTDNPERNHSYNPHIVRKACRAAINELQPDHLWGRQVARKRYFADRDGAISAMKKRGNYDSVLYVQHGVKRGNIGIFEAVNPYTGECVGLNARNFAAEYLSGNIAKRSYWRDME